VSTHEVRRRRQLDELRSLCGTGSVARAIDLAFEHFARFGQDDDVVVLLEAAVRDADDDVRRRLDDLLR
jgi:hypothetical protein